MTPTSSTSPLSLACAAGALLCCLLAPQVQAHETLPAQWCTDPNMEPQIVAQFNLTPNQLRAAARHAEQTLGPEGLIAEGLAEELPGEVCGVVDRWLMTQYLGDRFCASYATPRRTPKLFVTAPSSFLAPNHHTVFDYGQGVQGACVVCVPKP